MKISSLAGLLLGTCLLTSGAFAQIITNGDFASTVDVGGQAKPTSWIYTNLQVAPNAGDGTYGTESDAGGAFAPSGWNGTTPFAYIQEAGSLTQYITLSAQQTYTLTLEVATRQGQSSLPTVTLFDGISNVVLYQGVTPVGSSNVALSNNNTNFTINTFTFTTGLGAGSGAYLVLSNLKQYLGDGVSDNASDFTNVAIIAAVPEPTTWALLGLGCAMALTFRRRRSMR